MFFPFQNKRMVFFNPMSLAKYKAPVAGYLSYKGYKGYKPRVSSSYSYGNSSTVNRRVKRKRYAPNSLSERIRKEMPAKHFQTVDSTLTQNTLHNVTYVHSPTMNIAKGTSDNQRVGDKIHLEAIKFKMLFHDETLNVNATFVKLIIGYIDTDTFTSTGFQTGGDYSYGNGVAFSTNNITNPKKFTEIANYTIKMPHLVDGSKSGEVIEETLMLKKDFVYETNQVYGKDRNLVLIVTTSVVGGTPATTSTGNVFLTYDLIYKD